MMMVVTVLKERTRVGWQDEQDELCDAAALKCPKNYGIHFSQVCF